MIHIAQVRWEGEAPWKRVRKEPKLGSPRGGPPFGGSYPPPTALCESGCSRDSCPHLELPLETASPAPRLG